MNKILLLFSAIILFSCSTKTETDDILVSFVEKEEHYGFKNMKGDVVISAKYSASFTDTFNKKIAFVIDKKDGLIAIDKKGNYVLSPYWFDNGPDYFEEGLFRFTENKKLGFADSNGNKIISAQFEAVGIFSNNRAPFCDGCKEEMEGEYSVWRGGKWGFIDKTGKKIIPAQFDEVTGFDNGYAYVKLDSVGFDIDSLGKKVD